MSRKRFVQRKVDKVSYVSKPRTIHILTNVRKFIPHQGMVDQKLITAITC